MPERAISPVEPQSAAAVLMVRPAQLRVQFADCAEQRLPAPCAGGRGDPSCRHWRCANSMRLADGLRAGGSASHGRGRHAAAGQARRDIPQQLGELPWRRHGGAVSDAGPEPAQRAARGGAAPGERRWRISDHPHRRSELSRSSRASISRVPAVWCSTGPRMWPTRACRRAPISMCSANLPSSSTMNW